MTKSYDYKAGTNRLGTVALPGFRFLRVCRFDGHAHQPAGAHPPELNQLLGLVVTAVLLVSSFFMNRGETLIHNGDRKGFLDQHR